MSRAFRTLLPALFLAASTLSSQPALRPKAEALVKEGIAFLKDHGKEALLAEVNRPNGRFHAKPGSPIYLFVFDEKGLALAHGFQSNLVNVNRWDHKDADGKPFIQAIIAGGQKKRGDWVDYKYENPVSHKVEAKTSYCLAEGGVIVGCGIYK
jgi:signal transduction histidine kinase